jgi:undecaprenyl-diphosphatase
MFSELQAIILGAVQGLTEFLPVSSSAHLVLIPWLMGWDDPGLTFDVALHLGTLVALLVYYWSTWLRMATSLVNDDRESRRLLALVAVATVPGALVGFLFEKQAETVFRSPVLIAVTLATLGVALWFFDRAMPMRRKINEVTLRDALLIGLSQAFAIVPGVSRSGSTITMGRVMGLEREDAANFSFLMATPIIAGAGLIEGRKLLHNGLTADVWLGFGVSAIFGLIAIYLLLHLVRTRTYVSFAWYRILAAAFVFAVYFHWL